MILRACSSSPLPLSSSSFFFSQLSFFFSFYLCMEAHFIQYSFWNAFEILYISLVGLDQENSEIDSKAHTQMHGPKTAKCWMALMNCANSLKSVANSDFLNSCWKSISLWNVNVRDPSWLLAAVFFLSLFKSSLYSSSSSCIKITAWTELTVFIVHDCNERPVFRNVNAKLERSLKQNQK